MHYFLVGMPGSGKSYWGRIWAKRAGISFVDLDEEISMHEKRSIKEVFAEDGELYFREIEKKVLESIMAAYTENTIVACGGGTPCFFDNMQAMKEKGKVVFLDIPLEELYRRILSSNSDRPLLNTHMLREDLSRLYAQRVSIYKQAHQTLDHEIINEDTFAKWILTS